MKKAATKSAWKVNYAQAGSASVGSARQSGTTVIRESQSYRCHPVTPLTN